MNRTLLQDVDLWEAWIDFEGINSSYFGTIYVVGDVLVDKITSKPRIRKNTRNAGKGELILEINSDGPAYRMEEVMYSEPVECIDQYDSVSVYLNGERIVHINDIEVLV